MKAKIEDIRFGEGKLSVRVGFYFSVGELGYDECYRDVVDEEGNPTGEKRLYPFNTLGLGVALGTTKLEFRDRVVAKLRAFKEAHTKAADLQDWIGFEIEE